MARRVTQDSFESYRSQALQRWKKFECVRLAYVGLYQRSKKRADQLVWVTVGLAITTAMLSILQPFVTHATLSVATAIVGGLTGASGIFKQAFKWDDKLKAQRDILSQSRLGLTRIRQFIEGLAGGEIREEDEACLSLLDASLESILKASEVQDLKGYHSTAEENLSREALMDIAFHSIITDEMRPQENAPMSEPAGEAVAPDIGKIERG